ncbi:MAG: glycosyltransferase family 1 protein [Saprospiraceae bacterium]|jgi:spore maturation protein CgeB|nr:glycosyltransferase family 1 protein [Candidatus Brachybacter algidus]MBP7539179.1 glycosyltransferase family 1 protein [Saprospiraceae bacterium]MBP9758329.1 glycosyltransferase family 1 protein [Candidatus Dojkabacteria bacterium]
MNLRSNKIIIAGYYSYNIYETDFGEALKYLGNNVLYFKFGAYYNNLLGRLENHLNISLYYSFKLNSDLIRLVSQENCDILFVWKGVPIFQSTLIKIKEFNPNITIVSYNNDDPFSPYYSIRRSLNQLFLWNRFIRCIPYYDINFVFRNINIHEYDNAGSKKTRILYPSFKIDDVKGLVIPSSYKYDVLFIGHYEPHRKEIIDYLINNGIRVKVFGYWKDGLPIGYNLEDVKTLYGKPYFEAINSSKISLCFYSKLNRDEYSTRSFEVPAAFGTILSQRTPTMLNLYRENEEAYYFETKEECLDKVKLILSNEGLRRKVCLAGNKKVYDLQGDVKDRVSDWLSVIKKV